MTTRDLILFFEIQKIPHLAFERGFDGLSIQINECESALILVFLPHYFANSVNKSFCIISMNLAIKGNNFARNSEKISHLGFKMCIKHLNIQVNSFLGNCHIFVFYIKIPMNG